MNHGIFTFSNDCKESYDLMIKYVSKAERAVKKLKSKKIKQIKKFSTKFNVHEIAPIIRGLSSNNNDQHSSRRLYKGLVHVSALRPPEQGRVEHPSEIL